MADTQVSSTIQVKLVLFADLRRVLPPGHDGQFNLTMPAGSTIADLIEASDLQFHADEPLKAGINSEPMPLDTPINDGDEVVLFSPMEGG